MAVPTQINELVEYSTNFDTRANASPQTFNLTTQQTDSYSAVHLPFIVAEQALADARASGTRSASLTAARDAAKRDLLKVARELYAFVAASTNVTDADKILLGVRVTDRTPSPVPVPISAPGVDVVAAAGTTVVVRIHGGASGRRGKPAGCVAAWVYSFVGPQYPSDPAAWDFNGATTGGTFAIEFPDSVPGGSQVWVCAAWINPRQEAGPTSTPVTTRVQGGGMLRAA